MSYAKHVYRCSWTFTEVLDNIHEINGLTDFSLLDYHPQRYGGFVSILSYSLDGHNMIECLNLTEAELRKLVPRAAPYQKWDEKVRNLCVRVQPSGRRTFYFVYSVGGKTKWHRFGPADAVDIVAARFVPPRMPRPPGWARWRWKLDTICTKIFHKNCGCFIILNTIAYIKTVTKSSKASVISIRI